MWQVTFPYKVVINNHSVTIDGHPILFNYSQYDALCIKLENAPTTSFLASVYFKIDVLRRTSSSRRAPVKYNRFSVTSRSIIAKSTIMLPCLDEEVVPERKLTKKTCDEYCEQAFRSQSTLYKSIGYRQSISILAV